MTATKNGVGVHSVSSVAEGVRLMDRFMSVARADAVYSEPLTVGSNTIIQAAEVAAIGGYGFGEGSSGIDPTAENRSDVANETPVGQGQGGGGGGYFVGRPVATIIIENDQVRVEPIIDFTKVGLAFFTMLGSFLFMVSRMSRTGGGKQD